MFTLLMRPMGVSFLASSLLLTIVGLAAAFGCSFGVEVLGGGGWAVGRTRVGALAAAKLVEPGLAGVGVDVGGVRAGTNGVVTVDEGVGVRIGARAARGVGVLVTGTRGS